MYAMPPAPDVRFQLDQPQHHNQQDLRQIVNDQMLLNHMQHQHVSHYPHAPQAQFRPHYDVTNPTAHRGPTPPVPPTHVVGLGGCRPTPDAPAQSDLRSSVAGLVEGAGISDGSAVLPSTSGVVEPSGVVELSDSGSTPIVSSPVEGSIGEEADGAEPVLFRYNFTPCQRDYLKVLTYIYLYR